MIKPSPSALPRPRSLEENAKWISRTFCLDILIVISELIGNSKDFSLLQCYTQIALCPVTSMHHFEEVKGRNIQMCPRSLDWPLIGHDELLSGLSLAFVELSSHHPWQGIREHILPMYLLLSSLQETDYKNPQKTLHIYISVCHNSLGLGPSFYESHRKIFPVHHLLSS